MKVKIKITRCDVIYVVYHFMWILFFGILEKSNFLLIFVIIIFFYCLSFFGAFLRADKNGYTYWYVKHYKKIAIVLEVFAKIVVIIKKMLEPDFPIAYFLAFTNSGCDVFAYMIWRELYGDLSKFDENEVRD